MSELLNIHDLQRLFRLGRTATYRLTRTAGFPRAVMISPGCYRWQPDEVEDYIRNLPRTPSPLAATSRLAAEPQLGGTVRPKRIRRVGGAK
jgi:predicted DNA-binding transcriptional regulator AlpA